MLLWLCYRWPAITSEATSYDKNITEWPPGLDFSLFFVLFLRWWGVIANFTLSFSAAHFLGDTLNNFLPRLLQKSPLIKSDSVNVRICHRRTRAALWLSIKFVVCVFCFLGKTRCWKSSWRSTWERCRCWRERTARAMTVNGTHSGF